MLLWWLICVFGCCFSYFLWRHVRIDRWEIIDLESCLSFLSKKFKNQPKEYIRQYNCNIDFLKERIRSQNGRNLFLSSNVFLPDRVNEQYLINDSFSSLYDEYLALFKERRKYFMLMALSVAVLTVALGILKAFFSHLIY